MSKKDVLHMLDMLERREPVLFSMIVPPGMTPESLQELIHAQFEQDAEWLEHYDGRNPDASTEDDDDDDIIDDLDDDVNDA